jgi:mono/diheme cytochrome c family protein
MIIAKRSWMTTIGIGVVAVASSALAQGTMQGMDMGKKTPAAPAPIRVTMKELHAQGGVPKGWKFLLPSGDPAEGRKVFAAMECYACHEVKGEDFPASAKTPRDAGPPLTGMGPHHPPEYFAESIINPNRVILTGPGYTGPDGRSKMPSYADTMSLKQLIDVVAYLKSLTGGEMAHDGGSMKGGMPPGDRMKMK